MIGLKFNNLIEKRKKRDDSSSLMGISSAARQALIMDVVNNMGSGTIEVKPLSIKINDSYESTRNSVRMLLDKGELVNLAMYRGKYLIKAA